MRKIRKTANDINPGIEFGVKKPRVELIAPSSGFPSILSGSPVSSASAFRTFVVRIGNFPAIRTSPSIFFRSTFFLHHSTLLSQESWLGEKTALVLLNVFYEVN